ncbi:MAG: hypothetical protein ACKV2Q_31930, partial [Planctomycetaceae bacterium]
MRPLAAPTGIAVVNDATLEDRLQGVAQGMMHDTVAGSAKNRITAVSQRHSPELCPAECRSPNADSRNTVFSPTAHFRSRNQNIGGFRLG